MLRPGQGTLFGTSWAHTNLSGLEIVRVTSPSDASVTGGHLCVNGRFGWAFVERDGNGSPK